MTERLTNAQNKAGLKVPQDISWGVSRERLSSFGLSCVCAHSQEMCRAVVSSVHLWQELIYHRRVKTRSLRIRVSFPWESGKQPCLRQDPPLWSFTGVTGGELAQPVSCPVLLATEQHRGRVLSSFAHRDSQPHG